MPQPQLTEAQKSILKEVEEKLGEHFDAFVIISEAEFDDPDGNSITSRRYKGTRSKALGMMELECHDLKAEWSRKVKVDIDEDLPES